MTTSVQTSRPAYSPRTLNLVTASFMVVFHILAVAALFFFSWTNLLVALVLHWFAVGFGISLGYHRLHTHRGYKTSKAFEYFLAVCGTLTLEGGPIFWVATHRVHHQHSDQRRRSAHAARRRLLGAHGVDPLRRHAPQQHRADGEIRAGSRRRPVLSLAQHLSLRPAHAARASSCSPSAAGRWCCGASSSGSSSACTARGW